jgi:hypothetical protein
MGTITFDPSPFLHQLKIVGRSPYALIGYIVLAVIWAYTMTRAIRIRAIARTLIHLPEADRKSLLEKEFGYHLKEGMSARSFLKAQRSTYLFYGFISVIITALIISVVALLRGEPQVIDSKQAALCAALQRIIAQIDHNFEGIRGERIYDRDDATAVEYESTLTVPDSVFDTIDLSDKEPSLAATLYHGTDGETAYQVYAAFSDQFQACTQDWIRHADIEDSESLERRYVSFVKGDKKMIVSLKKYTNEPSARYYVTVLFCRTSLDDDSTDDGPEPSAVMTPQPSPH